MTRKTCPPTNTVGLADRLVEIANGTRTSGRECAQALMGIRVSPNPGVCRVSHEEAVCAVANTTWARGVAGGMARLAGLQPTEPDYQEFVDRYSRHLAEKVVR